jgi:hypothetical protein
VVLKLLVVLNVNHGPWLSGQFLAQKGEAVLLMMKAINAGDPRFEDFKEDIAFEQGLAPDSDPQLVFDAVLDLPTFRNPGPFVRPLIVQGKTCGPCLDST